MIWDNLLFNKISCIIEWYHSLLVAVFIDHPAVYENVKLQVKKGHVDPHQCPPPLVQATGAKILNSNPPNIASVLPYQS